MTTTEKKSKAAPCHLGFAPATATPATRGTDSAGRTCAEAQAANADRVEALLLELLERVPGMRSPTGAVHWGHVGSSNEVIRLLEQAARHA